VLKAVGKVVLKTGSGRALIFRAIKKKAGVQLLGYGEEKRQTTKPSLGAKKKGFDKGTDGGGGGGKAALGGGQAEGGKKMKG